MSATPTDRPRPLSLAKDGNNRLTIEWSDGHKGVYTWSELRRNCPCATCKGEFGQAPDPFRILTAAELTPKPPLAPVAVTPVGHYAYKIAWNDGHDTGIYTLEQLRGLCECLECKRRVEN